MRSLAILAFVLAWVGCGSSVDWFVSFNTGQVDEARQDGLVLIIGNAHPKPLQDVRLVEGELPPGMALQQDGTVRGIPEEEGLFEFTLELTEAGGKTFRKSYSVEVGEPPS